jgi:hypothetical protein
MTDEELAEKLDRRAEAFAVCARPGGNGWQMDADLLTLASARILHLSAVERAAREYDAAERDHLVLDCEASLTRVYKTHAALRSALEGGK